MVTFPCFFGHVPTWYIGMLQKRLLILWWAGSKEREKRARVPITTSEAHPE
jgi:hypothetical protein